MKKFSVVLLILFLIFPVLNSQKVDIYTRPENLEKSRDYDPLHYKLKFRFDETSKTLGGKIIMEEPYVVKKYFTLYLIVFLFSAGC
jgi:hypothetical protein